MIEPPANEKDLDVEAKLQAFKQRCRDAGLKVTPQRMAVYRVLAETTTHPSAEMVCRTLRRDYPTISLDTVNRTLLTLAEIGEAFVVQGSAGARRYDANLHDHQHFCCVQCKRIIDFHHEPFDRIEVPENIARKFTVLRKTVLLEGLCDRCGAESDPVGRERDN